MEDVKELGYTPTHIHSLNPVSRYATPHPAHRSRTVHVRLNSR